MRFSSWVRLAFLSNVFGSFAMLMYLTLNSFPSADDVLENSPFASIIFELLDAGQELLENDRVLQVALAANRTLPEGLCMTELVSNKTCVWRPTPSLDRQCCCQVWTAPATTKQVCLPSLVIIGAQKAGTTALLSYLSESPNLMPPKEKELHFFDRFQRQREKGNTLYRYLDMLPANKDPSSLVTVDATPSYILSPRTAECLGSWLPRARSLMILREPVDRAFSEYLMVARRVKFWDNLVDVVDKHAHKIRDCLRVFVDRWEAEERMNTKKPVEITSKESRSCLPSDAKDLPFYDRLAMIVRQKGLTTPGLATLFPETASGVVWNRTTKPDVFRLGFVERVRNEIREYSACVKDGDVEKVNAEPCVADGWSSNIETGAHLFRGIYSAQVETWLKSNSAERLFFISHNKLKSSPVETVAEVSKFLGLPQFLKYSMTEQELNKRIQDKYPGFWKEGWVIQGADQKFPEFVRPELEAFFKPFNRKLSRILRSFFGWSRAAASNPF